MVIRGLVYGIAIPTLPWSIWDGSTVDEFLDASGAEECGVHAWERRREPDVRVLKQSTREEY